MTSFFQRVGKEKTELKIQLVIHNVNAELAQNVDDLSIVFERGPQRDETKRFEMGPMVKAVEID
jgi:hypothetical protein